MEDRECMYLDTLNFLMFCAVFYKITLGYNYNAMFAGQGTMNEHTK